MLRIQNEECIEECTVISEEQTIFQQIRAKTTITVSVSELLVIEYALRPQFRMGSGLGFNQPLKNTWDLMVIYSTIFQPITAKTTITISCVCVGASATLSVLFYGNTDRTALDQ
jgi:hypothetical protein